MYTKLAVNEARKCLDFITNIDFVIEIVIVMSQYPTTTMGSCEE